MKKIMLLLLFLAGSLLAADADTVRLSDAITTVRYELGDADSTNCYWTNAALRNYIRSSLRDAASLGCVQKWDTVITTPDAFVYAMSSDFSKAVWVWRKTSKGWKSMQYRSGRVEKVGDIPFGRDAARDDPAYYTYSKQYLLIDPVGVSGDSIIVIYAAYGSSLAADTSIINVPYDKIRFVILGALKRALRVNVASDMYAMLKTDVDTEYQLVLADLMKQSEPPIIPVSK